MQKENAQKELMRNWWNQHKSDYLLERSIDKVYEAFQSFATTTLEFPPINKYIFRTYIRKNGYNNSSSDMKEYYQAKETKRLARKEKEKRLKEEKCNQ